MIPLSVFSFYCSKVIYGFDAYFITSLEPFIIINKFFTREIIRKSLSKCFARELLEKPIIYIIYNPRSTFFKDLFMTVKVIRWKSTGLFLLQKCFEGYAENSSKLNQCTLCSLHEKCPNTEFFLIQIRENTDQKISVFGHFTHSGYLDLFDESSVFFTLFKL